MECNRDEAIRAKEIAESKFSAREFAGAKKFALKAQSLYPGVVGIGQMLATIDVHIASANAVGGEADWYGILGCDPSTNDENVKKQYRKMALLLHPDKNSTVGADEAFKLLLQAWSLLSDKTKRQAFDQKWKVHQKEIRKQDAASREEARKQEALQREEAKRQEVLRKMREEAQAAAAIDDALQKLQLKAVEKLQEETQAAVSRQEALKRLQEEAEAAAVRHEALEKSHSETVQILQGEAEAASERQETLQRLYEEAQASGAKYETLKKFQEEVQAAATRQEALQRLHEKAQATAARLEAFRKTHLVPKDQDNRFNGQKQSFSSPYSHPRSDMQKSQRVVCRYFLQRRCYYGEKCKYLHEDSEN